MNYYRSMVRCSCHAHRSASIFSVAAMPIARGATPTIPEKGRGSSSARLLNFIAQLERARAWLCVYHRRRGVSPWSEHVLWIKLFWPVAVASCAHSTAREVRHGLSKVGVACKNFRALCTHSGKRGLTTLKLLPTGLVCVVLCVCMCVCVFWCMCVCV